MYIQYDFIFFVKITSAINYFNGCIFSDDSVSNIAANRTIYQKSWHNSSNIVVNIPQSDFTWQQSYIWRKQYTVPDGYTLEGIEVYSTNGDATLSGIYRSIDNAMYICVTGTYLDSTAWTVKPITNSYNFVCNVRLKKT